MTEMVRPTETPAWKALKMHYEEIKGAHLRQLFADDSTRAESFSAEGAGLFLDYSKNRITSKTIQLLLQENVVLRLIVTPCSGVKRSTKPKSEPCCT
jgi:hypothetical protein